MTEALNLSLLGPPLLAGGLVLASHVPLGLQVLARGIVFIDLAVAQVAGLGAVLAGLLGAEAHGPATQGAAAGAALAGALLLTWTDRRWPQLQEALIGTVFVLAATGGALLLAGSPHGSEHLRDLLVGQVLWVGSEQLWVMAGVSLAVLALRLGWPALREGVGFYALFALAVTASVQVVGVFLVFSCLILPALAVQGGGSSVRLPLALAVGLSGFAGGLAGAAVFDLPAGPAIVWSMAAAGAALAWLRRRSRPLARPIKEVS